MANFTAKFVVSCMQKQGQIMRKYRFFSGICALTFSFLLPGCDIETQSIVNPTEFSFNYDIEYEDEDDADEWVAFFADFPEEEEEDLEFSFEYDSLPENLPQHGAFRISGDNQHSNLFMFLRKQIDGLKPSTTYDIYFNITLASQYPEETGGASASHGASVALLVGAMQWQPLVGVVEGQNTVISNIDHFIPNEYGAMTSDVLNIGNIGIPGETAVYTLITRSHEDIPFVQTTDKDGSLWVIVGTDSRYEAVTTVYYDQIDIIFRENLE